jgi:hypothetical protein
VEANQISFPGLDTEKIIKADLLELPESYNIILVAKKEIEDVIEKILKTNFQFPISQLWIEQENIFELTEGFKTELEKNFESITENQTQNDVVNAVQKFCDAVNDLIELKAIRGEGNIWHFVGENLSLAIENTKGSARPLSPYRRMFQRTPLSRFATKKPFAVQENRSRSAILR